MDFNKLAIPTVSIVVLFGGYLYRILCIKLVKPKKELQQRLQVMICPAVLRGVTETVGFTNCQRNPENPNPGRPSLESW